MCGHFVASGIGPDDENEGNRGASRSGRCPIGVNRHRYILKSMTTEPHVDTGKSCI